MDSRFLDTFAGTGAVGIEASVAAQEKNLHREDAKTAALIKTKSGDAGTSAGTGPDAIEALKASAIVLQRENFRRCQAHQSSSSIRPTTMLRTMTGASFLRLLQREVFRPGVVWSTAEHRRNFKLPEFFGKSTACPGASSGRCVTEFLPSRKNSPEQAAGSVVNPLRAFCLIYS